MREMILSFKPHIFEQIRSGKKKFEYRYQFPNEEIRAYMYVSKPIQQIVGYLELGKRIEVLEWKEKYKNDSETSKRIEEYLNRNSRYAMPIIKFVMTNGISLQDIEKNMTKFIIPQSYYFMDTFPELKKYLLDNMVCTDENVNNSFETIELKDICVRKYE